MGLASTNDEWHQWLQEIDDAIRAGEKSKAKHQLQSAALAKIPNELRQKTAQLSRRADIPQLGLRLLAPLVHPTRKGPSTATPQEQTEYAACLIRVGAVSEGLALLLDNKDVNDPNVRLYTAFAHIAQWNYQSSIEPLAKYVRSPGISDYERLIGKANLAAAYIFQKNERLADAVLIDLHREINPDNMGLLYGSLLELSARQALTHNRWAETQKFIDEVERRFSGTTDIHLFYALKWKAALQLKKDGPTPSSLHQMQALREESRARRHWETLRECDRLEAVVLKNRDLFLKVYVGTPYASYRSSLAIEFGETPHRASWLWNVSDTADASPNPDSIFDVHAGKWTSDSTNRSHRAGFKPGQTLHRLLVSLSADFYRPQRLASLFGQLFPEEHFNPDSSPGRVHRALGRFRKESLGPNWDITVNEEGAYRLTGGGKTWLRVSLETDGTPSKTNVLEARLKERFATTPFSTSEAALALGLSRSAAQRIISELVQSGRLKASGAARSTRFSF